MLLLRTADAQRRSHNGTFQYPEFGPVEATDWNDRPECGGGLHGLRDGCGDAILLRTNEDAVWQVLEAPDDGPCVDLKGKVKVPKAVVVYSGDRQGAIAYLDANGCADKPVVFAARSSGNRGTSTSGDGGTSTSGYRGTSTSGYGGTSTSGNRGTSTSGYGGTSTSGDGGTSTSGYGGTSTSGDGGTSTSGYRGTSTSGYGGTSTSGEEGVLIITRWTGKRYVRVIAVVGENGIEPNVAYRLDEKGVFVKVEKPAEVAS